VLDGIKRTFHCTPGPSTKPIRNFNAHRPNNGNHVPITMRHLCPETTTSHAAVATELARCLGAYYSALWRYEPDGAATLLMVRDDDPGLKKMPVGARFSLEGRQRPGDGVAHLGAPPRMDSYENAAGSTAARLRDLGHPRGGGCAHRRRRAGCGGRPSSARRDTEPLPPPTPRRGVADFTDLVATTRSPTAQAPRGNLPRLGPRIVAARR